MYVLPWILIGSVTGWWTGKIFRGRSHRVGHWLVDRKDFPRKRLRPSDGHGHGHLRRCSGWDARAILQHWGARRNHEYDDLTVGASVLSRLASCVKGRGVYARQL